MSLRSLLIIRTVITSLILSFVNAGEQALQRFLILGIGGAVLAALAYSPWFNRRLTPLIERALRRSASLDLQDNTALLHHAP